LGRMKIEGTYKIVRPEIKGVEGLL
jgi:hypothetical protein